jgi:hypothetical protein
MLAPLNRGRAPPVPGSLHLRGRSLWPVPAVFPLRLGGWCWRRRGSGAFAIDGPISNKDGMPGTIVDDGSYRGNELPGGESSPLWQRPCKRGTANRQARLQVVGLDGLEPTTSVLSGVVSKTNRNQTFSDTKCQVRCLLF